MKKIRSRVITMLLVIHFISSILASIIFVTLAPMLFSAEDSAYAKLLKNAFQSGITLIFFAAFVILGVREITEPVIRLSKATKAIAAGDFAIQIPPTRRKDEIGTLENSFSAMVKELQSTEYIQKDFINNVSHEYKTPLSIIAGNAKLLKNGSLTGEQREQCCAYILEEVQRLSGMTSNILMLSKLENQGIRPVFGPFSLDEQLRQAARSYIDRCEENQLELDVELPQMTVVGSEDLLLHVWTNLLDNAVKFSRRGERITLRAEVDGEHIAVSIADQGIGMDDVARQHVFDQFYQADVSRQGAGSGLGLSLAQRIIQLHGGGIEVSSEPGQGSTFVVRLPQTR